MRLQSPSRQKQATSSPPLRSLPLPQTSLKILPHLRLCVSNPRHQSFILTLDNQRYGTIFHPWNTANSQRPWPLFPKWSKRSDLLYSWGQRSACHHSPSGYPRTIGLPHRFVRNFLDKRKEQRWAAGLRPFSTFGACSTLIPARLLFFARF